MNFDESDIRVGLDVDSLDRGNSHFDDSLRLAYAVLTTHVRAGLTTLTHGLPSARRLMLSAMVCLRRMIVPVVQPDMWGVITMFGNSWNGSFEGRVLGSL